jgi:replicative superfamily II helicase
MVDFAKLKTLKKKATPTDPLEIFRRLPKPPGINDLYTSQAEVLETWYKRRTQADVVLKLHTGGGKTLVGLLMAQSTVNETNEPVLYLTPTTQLVNQALEKARALGISAVPYGVGAGVPLDDDFVNGKAIMVGTYKALFNGMSKFGVRGGSRTPISVGAIVLDDAHVAFSVVRDTFTLAVTVKDNNDRYESLTGLFRKTFRDMDRLGTFDDTLSGESYGVIEVPYWAWNEQLDAVREQLRGDAKKYGLVWPLLRDNLHLCHALIRHDAFTVTPVLPLVQLFPTFSEAPRRIYMSATIADDSEIVRTFDADSQLVSDPMTSRSLAGVSERMILIPDLMPFKFKVREAADKLLEWTTDKRDRGAIVLVPSDRAAEKWKESATFAEGSTEVQAQVDALQAGTERGPVVFSNRYDGIDLPGNSCRLLVMDGLPSGTSDYELLRASALYGGGTISRMLAQRIEQGIGRGARGSGDHCVVILMGADLAAWIAKDANFKLLTSATRAQLDMGSTVSRAVKDLKDLAKTVGKSYDRDSDWIGYHAETLAEEVESEVAEPARFDLAADERKAFNLWHDGYHEKAVARIEMAIESARGLDNQTRGWLQQLAARIASQWGQSDRAEDLQRQAFGSNRNLLRPKVPPPYRALAVPGRQANAIAAGIGTYRMRRGFLQRFEEVVAHLHPAASANQFEQGLADLGAMLGLATERYDTHGVGPDVLWLLPDSAGWVIEAKSRKSEKNALTKEEHGQLLVAEEWFNSHYEDLACVRVSVHATNKATEPAAAAGSFALTYEKLAALVSDARALFTKLCESQLDVEGLVADCARELARSAIRADRLKANYLAPFSAK